jgi:hypothetical protein
MSNSNFEEKKDYTSISLTRIDLNLNNTDKKVAGEGFNWLDKKLKKIKKLSYESWILAKQGVFFGCIVGSCMGLIFGGYEAIKQRKFILLPLSMLTFSGFFGSIFGISTIIRMESNDRDKDKDFVFEVLEYDGNINGYRYKKFNYLNKKNFNIDIKNGLDI